MLCLLLPSFCHPFRFWKIERWGLCELYEYIIDFMAVKLFLRPHSIGGNVRVRLAKKTTFSQIGEVGPLLAVGWIRFNNVANTQALSDILHISFHLGHNLMCPKTFCKHSRMQGANMSV